MGLYRIDIDPFAIVESRELSRSSIMMLFSGNGITHDKWIQRFVELLSVRDQRQPLVISKVKKILNLGISSVIEELPSTQSGYGYGLMIKLGHPEDFHPITRTIRCNYNKIDSSGNTVLDKLIQKVSLSGEELFLASTLLMRDATISSTSIETLEKFKTFVKEKHLPTYQNQTLQFEAKINHLVQAKLNGLL